MGLRDWLGGSNKTANRESPATVGKHTTISSVVLAVPTNVRQPQLSKGQSLLNYVASKYPEEYTNFKARVKKELGIDPSTLDGIGRETEIEDDRLRTTVMAFVGVRLPTYFRTVEGLCKLREVMEMSGFPLAQVIAGAATDLDMMSLTELNVEIVTDQSSNGWRILPRIRGELLWQIAGGTRVTAHAVMRLQPVVQAFAQAPKLALYHDRAYSFVYRTAALKALIARGMALPNDTRKVAEILYDSGHQVLIDPPPESALSTLEPFYQS